MDKSSSEVIRDSLRLLGGQEEQRMAMVEDLRQELLVGINQLDSNKAVDFDPKLIETIKVNGRQRL